MKIKNFENFDAPMSESRTPSVDELIDLFTRVNRDIKHDKTGESIVPLTDWEYYSEQIENIFGLDAKKARELAKEMAAHLNDGGE